MGDSAIGFRNNKLCGNSAPCRSGIHRTYAMLQFDYGIYKNRKKNQVQKKLQVGFA